MPSTLQINLTEVRHIAWTVTGVAGFVAEQGFRLRIAPGTPATDTTSLFLARVAHGVNLRLAYAAESAADELARATEGIVAYAQDGANLARRTELAVMGLDVDALGPIYVTSTARAGRHTEDHSPPAPESDTADDRALSEAVLLSNGVADIAHTPADTTQLRAASATLRDCARKLRAALSSGERPAAMLDGFGMWLDGSFGPAVEAANRAMDSWGAAYSAARREVEEPARLYLRWLSAAAAGGGHEESGLQAAAARARAAVREYSGVSFAAVDCEDHPRLGGRPS